MTTWPPCHICGNTIGPCEHPPAYLYPEEETMDTDQHEYVITVSFKVGRHSDPSAAQEHIMGILLNRLQGSGVDWTIDDYLDLDDEED